MSVLPFFKRTAGVLTLQTLDEAVEAAQSGTLYLDEVSTLSSAVQFALLDRLESGARARIIAGSTRDLTEEVDAGRLSADLYYRLDLMRVRIPSLSERPEDIPVIFRHYVAQACEQANIPLPHIPPDYLGRLMAQNWPGNARALMNAAMRFALGVAEVEEATGLGLAEQMAQVERSLLVQALQRSGGNATDAARALKLPRKTFYDKLTRHDIKPEDYRNG